MDEQTKIAIFKGQEIRKTIFKKEWWFSVIDIVEVLTGTERPRKYWSDLKTKIIKEGYNELSEKIGQLKLQSSDGKFYETDCAKKELEQKSGKKVTTKQNYLTNPQSNKKLGK